MQKCKFQQNTHIKSDNSNLYNNLNKAWAYSSIAMEAEMPRNACSLNGGCQFREHLEKRLIRVHLMHYFELL